MPFKIQMVQKQPPLYKVKKDQPGRPKYFSKYPMSLEKAKAQLRILDQEYYGGDASSSVVNTGTNVINTLQSGLEKLPEVGQIFKFGRQFGDVVQKFLPDYRTESTKFREKYGLDYDAIVEKYGEDSEPAKEFRYFYPGSTTENQYLYTEPQDPSSGLRYPQNYQDLYMQTQKLSTNNYFNVASGIAKKLGIVWGAPETNKIISQLYKDHSSLSTTGHY